MRYVLKMSLGLAALVCMITGMPSNGQAYTGDLRIPQEGVTQIVTLEDGSSLIGKITEIRAEQIKFETSLGEITIQLAKIKSIEETQEAKAAVEEEAAEVPAEEAVPEAKVTPEAEVTPKAEVVSEAEAPQEVKPVLTGRAAPSGHPKGWFPNPNRTRLLLGPTARTLKAGDGYIYDLWLFFPGLAYGITDNFMISAGASIIPDADEQMFYIMPKLGFPASEQVDLSASLIIFRLWDETFYFGMGGITLGTDDMSLTGALGLAFTNDEMAENPAAMVGGEFRFSPRMSLVGEGWFIPGDEDDGMLGFAGIRLMGEQMTVDLGVAFSYEDRSNQSDYYGNPEEDEVDGLPYVDFVWNF